MKKLPRLLEVPATDEAALIFAARDERPISGLTHNFYRYPARFSPAFARQAIRVLSSPGDLILDPFVGGGTTLVEALTLGRNAVGSDISSLAAFVAAVKTTRFSDKELQRLRAWADRLPQAINIHRHSIHFEEFAEAGYYKHLNHSSRWRLRKAIEQALGSAIRLGSSLEPFGRCVVLRTAQWALDGRKKLPSIAEFRSRLVENAREMVTGARAFSDAVSDNHAKVSAQVLHRSAIGLETAPELASFSPPKLILTSPPYPGVHMLYHRWQVDGRKEAPAPFWIANKLDGAGSSFYTMGDRKHPELNTYFRDLKATMSSVAAIADEETIVVQVIAFTEANWQLPRYLKTMEDAGFVELQLPSLQSERDKRLWRSVPGRRWYSDQRGVTPGSKEVVLFHTLRRPPTCGLNARVGNRPSGQRRL